MRKGQKSDLTLLFIAKDKEDYQHGLSKLPASYAERNPSESKKTEYEKVEMGQYLEVGYSPDRFPIKLRTSEKPDFILIDPTGKVGFEMSNIVNECHERGRARMEKYGSGIFPRPTHPPNCEMWDQESISQMEKERSGRCKKRFGPPLFEPTQKERLFVILSG